MMRRRDGRVTSQPREATMRFLFPAVVTIGLGLLPSSVALSQDTLKSVSISNLDMAAAPPLSPELIRAVQDGLLEREIRPGPRDGLYGPKTASAIRTFQERFGMKPSGQIDNQLLFGLGLSQFAANP
jgi:peptidoglycan hydrolase-like protein with peptidoglycan-binding domain